MAVTIRDVAKAAKVAPSTVSRVIANSPKISEETKRRVREIMEQLAYYPNFQAQSLAQNSTQTLGVIMPNSAYHSFRNPFFPEVLRGICTIAHSNKYGIYLSTGASECEIFEEVVTMVQGKRVDGLILLFSKINDKTMNYLMETGFPFTLVGRPYTNQNQITYVDNNNIEISKEVTNYLIELGHKHIAFIGGKLNLVVNVDRLDGYKEALIEAGLLFHEEYVITDQFEESAEALEYLLALPQPPTAIVTKDDMIAYEMISRLQEKELSVPEDISMISFNNLTLSEHSKPPLTSVDINIFELGFEAASSLIEKIKDPNVPVKNITVQTRLIERKSCSRKI